MNFSYKNNAKLIISLALGVLIISAGATIYLTKEVQATHYQCEVEECIPLYTCSPDTKEVGCVMLQPQQCSEPGSSRTFTSPQCGQYCYDVIKFDEECPDYYGGGEYGGDEYGGSEYSGGEYGGSEYSGGEYGGSEYSGGEYGGSEYSGGEYGGSEYSGGEYPTPPPTECSDGVDNDGDGEVDLDDPDCDGPNDDDETSDPFEFFRRIFREL